MSRAIATISPLLRNGSGTVARATRRRRHLYYPRRRLKSVIIAATPVKMDATAHKARKGRSYAVFCGSRPGSQPIYSQAAEALGRAIASRQGTLVYGGGSLGLMGVVATTVAKHTGPDHVIEVLPEMYRDSSGEQIGERTIVKTLEERKALMMQLSDANIALPGSYGTLEEIATALAARVYYGGNIMGLLNVNHFYDNFVEFLDLVLKEGFVRSASKQLFVVSDDPEELLQKLEDHLETNNVTK